MKKTMIILNEAEWRYTLYALNELRNSLIREKRYTGFVDNAIMKIVNAPVKRLKTAG